MHRPDAVTEACALEEAGSCIRHQLQRQRVTVTQPGGDKCKDHWDQLLVWEEGLNFPSKLEV